VKRGTKPGLPSQRIARGTYRPDRDGGVVEVIEPESLPQRPDWLTSEGEEVWMDDVGRVAAHKLVSEKDASAFGQYCNLMGACIKAWRSGNVPPITAIAESRKMQELFGICGARSRLKVAQQDATTNPFARNGRRR
jgi:hypothetical protein